MIHRSPKDILKATPLFAALDEAELTSLAARSGMRTFDAGESLFGESEPCKGLYVVVAGRVRIFKGAGRGRERGVSGEGPGASGAGLAGWGGGGYGAWCAGGGEGEGGVGGRA